MEYIAATARQSDALPLPKVPDKKQPNGNLHVRPAPAHRAPFPISVMSWAISHFSFKAIIICSHTLSRHGLMQAEIEQAAYTYQKTLAEVRACRKRELFCADQ